MAAAASEAEAENSAAAETLELQCEVPEHTISTPLWQMEPLWLYQSLRNVTRQLAPRARGGGEGEAPRLP